MQLLKSLQNKKRLFVIAIIGILAAVILLVGLNYLLQRPFGFWKNIVGVIRIEGYIEDSQTTSSYANAINKAMLNESIKAVIVVIDSGGGYANYVEQLYLDFLKLREKKPLVASVTTALSGGYYIALAADYICATPTAFVGNVGVIGIGPPIVIPSEQQMETGVYKLTGFSRLLFFYNLSHALENFASAVISSRGSRLKLSSDRLKTGAIYLGSEAVNVGLIDEVGSVQAAIEKAAERAALRTYEVVELKKDS
ncbi:MAG: S49 family peptidase, partial [Thermoproteota archaeon]